MKRTVVAATLAAMLLIITGCPGMHCYQQLRCPDGYSAVADCTTSPCSCYCEQRR